jgi:16S rRNA (uracil1498-N3)-methyltransferase
VDRIILLHCERSVVRWDAGRSERNVERLERVARSALEQSRRVHRCVIEGPVSASAVLPEAVAAEPGGRHLEAGDRLVAIGPEGGWSPSEVDLARDRVGLADTVLRVETAALVAAVKMTGMR